MDLNTAYSLLDCDWDTDKADISANYRRMAKKYHPDVNETGKEELMKQLNAAYEYLKAHHVEPCIGSWTGNGDSGSSRKLDEHQAKAKAMIVNSLSSLRKVFVMCGSAGRGKSTVVAEAIGDLLRAGLWPDDIRIMTPTGKAASVVNRMLREFFGGKLPILGARTIHRGLGCKGPMMGWKFNEKNKLKSRIIILDESSMIDSALLARVIKSVDRDCKIIMVGDHEQLFPVSAGCPFFDIIKYGDQSFVSKLVVNYRQQAGYLLADGIEQVLRGEVPIFGKRQHDTLGKGQEDNIFFEGVEDAVDVPAEVIKQVKEWEKNGVDYIVLSPQWRGPAGVDKINEVLQQELNPVVSDGAEEEGRSLSCFAEQKGSIKLAGRELREGDRVKQTKNDYDLGVFNGFIGRIIRIAVDESGEDYIVVDFDGKEYRYIDKKQINNLQLGYCVTVHSSQGSEYEKVCMVCHSTHAFMLSKQLLYVAFSRARQELVVVGNKKGLKLGIRNRRAGQRQTYLSLEMGGGKVATPFF